MQDASTPNNLKVAYLGPSASFSHQAAAEAFPQDTAATLHPIPSFKSLFSAIQDSTQTPNDVFDYAVVPVENSTNGGVVQVLDLLIQCGLDPASCLFPDVEVIAEHYLEVHHCLYIHPTAAPTHKSHNDPINKAGIPISDLNITAIYSHPQVWGQCNNFLSKHFSPAHTERIDLSSTSAAAVFVAQHPFTNPRDTPTATPEIPAAICSSLAGAQNKLALVALNIEDEPGKNTTRFLIIRNRHRPSVLPPRLREPATSPIPRPVFYKSLLTFTIPHTVPGSLASALAVFSQFKFNLTSITTRPSRERNWHYVFFVECQKEADRENKNRIEDMRKLVAGLKAVADRTCWLGSWIDRLRHE